MPHETTGGELLTTKELARHLKCSESLLEKQRHFGKGIPYLKLGRKCLYRSEDVQKYLEATRVGEVTANG